MENNNFKKAMIDAGKKAGKESLLSLAMAAVVYLIQNRKKGK